VRAGKPATEPPPPAQDSFAVVAENWIKRHVVARGLRSKDEIERSLAKYVLPSWRDRSFTEIKRRDVALLLDDIEDNHGARQADAVLTIIRSIANWYATRDDNYVVPIVKGMKRATNGSRARILNDDELRIIWKAGEDSGPFGSLVQMALLTAQRRDKLLNMRWSDISANGVWSIPSEAREKGNAGELVLPELALAILHKQPRILGTELVFAPAYGKGRISCGRGKAALDAKLPPDMPRWTVHDLRRTARSFMARAGVLGDHAERVLGHVIPGVEGVYDRHSYSTEKRIALEKLAALIAEIVNPPSDKKVVPMRKTATP